MIVLTLLIQFALSAAINNHGIQAIKNVLNPSEAIRTQYKKDLQPSLKGLIAKSMFTGDAQPNVMDVVSKSHSQMPG